MAEVRIGTAGWAIPRAVADRFPSEGSGLQRYAARFHAAEINATFYRLPRASTLERWRETAPQGFRFALKLPRAITHEARLVDCAEALAHFAAHIAPLADRTGPLLVQLPPRLAFDAAVAEAFFADLRRTWPGGAVCEPRHPTWFEPDAEGLLEAHRIARVAADPARAPQAAQPGGWAGLAYFRLHGSPRMYWSSYVDEFLADLAAEIRASEAPEVWCVFDNTTSGAAAANALSLQARLAA